MESPLTIHMGKNSWKTHGLYHLIFHAFHGFFMELPCYYNMNDIIVTWQFHGKSKESSMGIPWKIHNFHAFSMERSWVLSWIFHGIVM